MKKHSKTNLLILMFTFFFIQSATSISVQSTSETYPINLRGEFITGDLRSGGDIITAEIQDGVIVVSFNKDIGNLITSITYETYNSVYEATVNTSLQQQMLIPLSGFVFGTYVIKFSNEKGEICGEFNILDPN